ncbi:hypothetical protein PTSG_11954 [Salpingoeca rosetta]|uniref:TOG domain-containing protein n=1 Tax=Salpingoeca rosetta (strain ATCC 50818 / BSB-021) TaxID=946362 RepID=F2U418_SALR5|nr:uncharacterized protein PTSG_11954 [Salpingoeca rosetta]EGD82362.1 hypothetical protein PTSG_11954 [Salpingoeca rosetta]|eukprot:XP_004996545.1 hypothetical protein PTSG_11954 [Salpingoeca rosetta]
MADKADKKKKERKAKKAKKPASTASAAAHDETASASAAQVAPQPGAVVPVGEMTRAEELAVEAYNCRGSMHERLALLQQVEHAISLWGPEMLTEMDGTELPLPLCSSIVSLLIANAERNPMNLLQEAIMKAYKLFLTKSPLNSAFGFLISANYFMPRLCSHTHVKWTNIMFARFLEATIEHTATTDLTMFFKETDRQVFALMHCYDAALHDTSAKARALVRGLRRLLIKYPVIIEHVTFESAMRPTTNISLMCTMCIAVRDNEDFQRQLDKHHIDFLDQVALKLILPKERPSKTLLDTFKPLIAVLPIEELAEDMTRVIKRQAEKALPVLAAILQETTRHMDADAMELLKLLTPSLINTNADIRSDALKTAAALFACCGKLETQKEFASHILAVIKGNHGQVTQWEQRYNAASVLSTVKDIKGPAEERRELRQLVLTGLIPLFEKESHEPTKQHMLCIMDDVLAADAQILPEVTAFLKKSLSNAKTTAATRVFVMRAALAHFTDAFEAAGEFLPLLEKSISAAPKQELSWHGQAEAAYAALIYFKHAETNEELFSSLQSGGGVWAKLNGGNVFNDRLVSECTREDAICVATLCCRALETFYADEPRPDLHWARVLISVMCDHPCSRTRRAVHTAVAPHLQSISIGAALSLAAAHFTCMRAAYRRHTGLPAGERVPFLCSATTAYMTSLLAIASRTPISPEDENRRLLHALLLNAHHPHVAELKSDLVRQVGQRLYDVTRYVEEKGDDVLNLISNTVTDCYDTADAEDKVEAVRNMLRSLTQLPTFGAVRQQLVQRVLTALGQPALLSTTMDDVGILNTPEGELYDTSFLPKAEEQPRKNQKGYADLKWEMEVRKELAKKKGKSLDSGPKLSKHHLELKNKTLKAESEKRKKLRALDQQLFTVFATLEGLLRGNVRALGPSVPALVSSLLRAVKMSALAGPRAAAAFVKLSAVLRQFVRADEARDLAIATIRLSGSKAPLPAEWEETSVTTLTVRLLRDLLHIAHDEHHRVDDVGMSYLLPLMAQVMSSPELKDSTREDAMVFLGEHAHLGASGLIARFKVLSLLVEVMRNHSRIAHQAGIMMVAFAKHMQAAAADVEVTAKETDVLFDAYDSESPWQRSAVMQSLLLLPFELDDRNATVIWVATHDPEEDVAAYAKQLWTTRQFELPADACSLLEEPLTSKYEPVRVAAAAALSTALEQHRDQVDAVLDRLLDSYVRLLIVPEPVRDHVGNIISEPFVDPWPSRAGLAIGLGALAPFLNGAQTLRIVDFMLKTALGDRSAGVREAVVSAGQTIMMEQGRNHVAKLLPVFDRFLSKPSKTSQEDTIRRGAIVLFGSVATHLDPADPRIPSITDSLIATLSTPSQRVQEAVAKCLQPLLSCTKDRGPELVDLLLNQVLRGETYGERRGAAYGLAAVVKSCGLKTLKSQDAMARLTTALESKKQEQREGALMAIELLSITLGRTFEPHVVELSQYLMLSFGDPKRDVRAAAKDTARAVMSKLTGHGVKKMLPKLLECVQSDNWRTKQGSVQMLGSMAFCAPKQLSSCLPTIVPHLTEVLTDSHAKVQAAGKDALKKVGSVVKNPEIKSMVNTILKALSDPVTYTEKCLTKLMNMAFVHVIDSPSLALIMPVMERALQDRSTRVKTKAATIIGNMNTLTDPNDLAPYLDGLVPGLKEALIDPVPEMRAVASNALGALVKGMGEERFAELLPWLLDTLASDASSADRAGAAQGLAEVLAALGPDRLVELMPTFLENTQHPKPAVREGYLMLLMFLPLAFGEAFQPHVVEIIDPILHGLSDIEESVRDAALKTGRTIITNYIGDAITLLLPALTTSALDDDWHMRFAALTLCGDLLYQLAGTSGNKSTLSNNEDDSLGTATSNLALVEKLGEEQRNRVLALIYFLRRDDQLHVRDAALHIWKVLVDHSMRTLREILHELMRLIFTSLAHESEFRQATAARTLGEIVRKMGDRVLGELVPQMKEGLKEDSSQMRQGVCYGLSEVLAALSNDQARNHLSALLPAIKRALVDKDASVREAAGQTFGSLHDRLGNTVIDQIVPALIEDIDAPDCIAIDALCAIITHKAKVVLPVVVPHLLRGTMTKAKASAISRLILIDQDAGQRQANDILTRLVKDIKETDDGAVEHLTEALTAVIFAMSADNLTFAVGELRNLLQECSSPTKRAVLNIIRSVAEQFGQSLPEWTLRDLLEAVVLTLDEDDKSVLFDIFGALNELCELGKKYTAAVAVCARDALSNVRRVDERYIAGFHYPRMAEVIATVYVHFLSTKDHDQRTCIVQGLGEMSLLCPPEQLSGYVRKMVAPLVRIASTGQGVERSMLFMSVARIVENFGEPLTSFAPQLQPIAVKGLTDPDDYTRAMAIFLISRLIPLQRVKRVEALLKALCSDCNKKKGRMQTAYLKAINVVLNSCHSYDLSQDIRFIINDTLKEHLASEDPGNREFSSEAFAHIILDIVPREEVADRIFYREQNRKHRLQELSRLILLARLVEIRWEELLERYPPPEIYDNLALDVGPLKQVLDEQYTKHVGFYGIKILRIGSEMMDDQLTEIGHDLFYNSYFHIDLESDDSVEQLYFLKWQLKFTRRKTPLFKKKLIHTLTHGITRVTVQHCEFLGSLIGHVLDLDGTLNDKKRLEEMCKNAPKDVPETLMKIYRKYMTDLGRPLSPPPDVNLLAAYD